jgi:hypothetical protein
MFRKVLTVAAVILVAAVIFTGCSKPKATTASGSESIQPASDASSKAVSSKLTVVAPEGWAPSKYNAAMMMKGTGTYSITEESMPANAAKADAYMEFAKAAFAKSFKNFKAGALSSLQVSGNEARRFEFSGEASGITMNYIMIYVFKDNRAYVLTCGAMSDTFGSLKADYDKIIASAKIEQI